MVGEIVPVHLVVLSMPPLTRARAESSENPIDRNYMSRYPGGAGHFGRAYKEQLTFVYPFRTPRKWHWEALCDEMMMPLTTECELEDHPGHGCNCDAESRSEPRYYCLSVGRMLQHPTRSYDAPRPRFRHWWLLPEAMPSGDEMYKRIGIGYFHRNRPNIFKFGNRRAVTTI